MYIKDSVYLLMRRVAPESAMRSWLETRYDVNKKPLYKFPGEGDFCGVMQDNFGHYSVDEAKNVFGAVCDLMGKGSSLSDSGVFGLLALSVKDLLTVDVRQECICRFRSLLKFRMLSHPIDQLIFVSSFLALYDLEHSNKRNVFSFPPIVRTDNLRLHHLLDSGMAENHFHIGGSTSSFLFSWISLMNHFDHKRRKEFEKTGMDSLPLDQRSSVVFGERETFYSLTFKASCIRYFLFLRLNNEWPVSKYKAQLYFESNKGEQLLKDPSSDPEEMERLQKILSERWLEKMLLSTDNECDLYLGDMDARFHALRTTYCGEDPEHFIPDYAMAGEPPSPMDDCDTASSADHAVRNFERRVYRSISGEQRFQYHMFKAIFAKDERVLPYADLMYAYLLIYCKLRGELIQTNQRVGFGNFLEYQDRKDVFVYNLEKYSNLKSCVAQQVVIMNPQVRYLEGRFIPTADANSLVEKTKWFYEMAQMAENYSDAQGEHIRQCAEEKLHYVCHFAKRSQPIKRDDPDFEMQNPRDSVLRKKAHGQAEAIIRARGMSTDIMSRVTGIDACSNEIGCRPEVFACAFRKILESKESPMYYFHSEVPLPTLRVTYHAGEDFLDVSDGLRAIDEAMHFLEMKRGDRFGHALALGIDVEEWYSFKNYTVILTKQDHMDNLAWLYGKMQEYNIYNRPAEDHINTEFRRLFNEIYMNNISPASPVCQANILDYYYSQKLRGNDPMLYVDCRDDFGPQDYSLFLQRLEQARGLEPWRLGAVSGGVTDIKSVLLYHHYHFNPELKKASSERNQYEIPRSIINAVSEVQKNMRYDIADKGLAIEANPSSNYLIGTFRDYCKHPIFAFNDTGLTDTPGNPKISVSINTDDLGIFDTTLENEYALLACALEERNLMLAQEDRIPPENIYRWLDHVRQMGCEQSFKHHS